MRFIRGIQLDEETRQLIKRTLFRVVVIICLYPILLGGVAGLRTQYRARWLAMRAEHRAAMERAAVRRARMEAESGSIDPASYSAPAPVRSP